jgi:hypothetical protein
MASAPITERPNPLTMGLGSSTAAEVVHLLCQTDAQMFAGWGGHPGLSDDIVLQVCDHIHAHIHTTVLCTRCTLGMYGCTNRERTCPAQHCKWNVLHVLHCSLLVMHDQMLISSVAISLGIRERMLHSSFLSAPPAYQACCSAGLIAHHTRASASTHSALASHMCSCAYTLRTHHSRPCRP